MRRQAATAAAKTAAAVTKTESCARQGFQHGRCMFVAANPASHPLRRVTCLRNQPRSPKTHLTTSIHQIMRVASVTIATLDGFTQSCQRLRQPARHIQLASTTLFLAFCRGARKAAAYSVRGQRKQDRREVSPTRSQALFGQSLRLTGTVTSFLVGVADEEGRWPRRTWYMVGECIPKHNWTSIVYAPYGDQVRKFSHD